MAKRVCTVRSCHVLVDKGESRCPAHQRAARRQRGDPTGRHEHRRVREQLLPLAYGKPCPICGRTMLPGDSLDLDHTIARAEGNAGPGDRITHARCNRSSGGVLGAQARDHDA